MIDFLKSIAEFLVFTVIVKAVIAHYLAEVIMKYAKKEFEKTERSQTIWGHYLARARGEGHGTNDVSFCHEGSCATL